MAITIRFEKTFEICVFSVCVEGGGTQSAVSFFEVAWQSEDGEC